MAESYPNGQKTLGKGEIANYKQFLLFPQCFHKAFFSLGSNCVIVWEWVKELLFYFQIIDVSYVYDNINLGRRIDVQWPNDEWRNNGGKNAWGGWVPTVGMEGIIVHRWSPFHREIMKRSHTDKTIVLVQIGERYVPVCDLGVQDMGPEVC